MSAVVSGAARTPAAGVSKRAARRHLVLGVASGATAVIVMLVTELSSETWGAPSERKTDGWLWQFNVATGTVALLLLVATLVYRPARIVSGRPAGPVHLPWRRTMGVWAAIAVVAHVPGGLAIHTSGWRIWTPFESVFPWVDGRPFDEFTIGYWMGLLAVLALVPLVATSNNAAIRRLGAQRWQRRHRVWVWVTYWLVALHVVALQYGEFRNRRHVAVTAMIFGLALAARILAWWRTRAVRKVPGREPREILTLRSGGAGRLDGGLSPASDRRR